MKMRTNYTPTIIRSPIDPKSVVIKLEIYNNSSDVTNLKRHKSCTKTDLKPETKVEVESAAIAMKRLKKKEH